MNIDAQGTSRLGTEAGADNTSSRKGEPSHKAPSHRSPARPQRNQTLVDSVTIRFVCFAIKYRNLEQGYINMYIMNILLKMKNVGEFGTKQITTNILPDGIL